MAKKGFNDHPFPYHHELELEISTLTNRGAGLGRVPLSPSPQSNLLGYFSPGHKGEKQDESNPIGYFPGAAGGQWVVMVPFTLPGERVRARVFRNHKNYSEADLVAVITPSPHRVAPRCELFGACGGCQYQHLAYAGQLVWKQRQVEELLQHMAGITHPVAPVIGSPREFGYRSKITPHFKADRANRPDEPRADGSSGGLALPQPPIGFLRQGTRFDIVDVPRCDIATPEINAALTEVRARTQAKLAAGEYKRDATLLLRHAMEGVITDYDAVITEEVGPDLQPSPRLRPTGRAGRDEPGPLGDRPLPAGPGSPSGSQLSTLNSQPGAAQPLRLRFLARDFFQNNPFILPAFTGYVREQAASSGARFLVDAYCGSGLFALSAAAAFERVAGVEISESSIAFAKQNAAANGIGNASFLAGDASAIFAGLDFPAADTAVIIDPPRKGCDESFLNQLFAFGPRAVVYVSCDPATQMRDLRHFLDAGYTLTAVQPFDLFPQTRHLECVITLARAANT